MNDALPPPPPPSPPPGNTGLLITCATIVLLAAIASGGYVVRQELRRLESARPAAPPEVTQALSELRTRLDRQRSDSTAQMTALQQEIAALKDQASATPQPDMQQTLAPVQEKLDAIAAQLHEPPPPPAAPPSADHALRDYLALRHAVESGRPYAAELAVLIPELPPTQMDAIATLQQHAEAGLPLIAAPEAEEPAKLAPWMESLNTHLHGLLRIEAKAPPATSADREAVMAALDRIEAGLLGSP